MTGLLTLVLCLWSSAAGAEPVVAVLSSNSGVYNEALAAFTAAYGSTVPVYDFGRGRPDLEPDTRVVVTFGGKAATARWPDQAALIYAAAPGTEIPPRRRSGITIPISMVPAPRTLLTRLRALQPGLRRLAVLCSGHTMVEFHRSLKSEGEKLGVTVLIERLSPDELPDRLRALDGRMDAVWLPPDPLFITEDSFATLRVFSKIQRIPLYVPTSGLVARGATASVGYDLRAMGTWAGRAARAVLAGRSASEIAALEPELAVHRDAARDVGLELSTATLLRAATVYLDALYPRVTP